MVNYAYNGDDQRVLQGSGGALLYDAFAKSATLAARSPLGGGKVLQLYRHTSPTLALRFSDGERITTTAGHPFFVAGVGFVPAGRLAICCQNVTRAGPALRLETEHATGKLQTVYNFEVAAPIPTLLAKLGSGYTITADQEPMPILGLKDRTRHLEGIRYPGV